MAYNRFFSLSKIKIIFNRVGSAGVGVGWYFKRREWFRGGVGFFSGGLVGVGVDSGLSTSLAG